MNCPRCGKGVLRNGPLEKAVKKDFEMYKVECICDECSSVFEKKTGVERLIFLSRLSEKVKLSRSAKKLVKSFAEYKSL